MNVVKSFLMFAEVIVSVLLIVVVVMQSSKTSGMGAVSGGGDSVFGGKAQGLDGFLSKCTVILGVIFAVFSLWLGIYLNHY